MKTLDDVMEATIHEILGTGLDIPLLECLWKAAKKGNGQTSENLSSVVVETMRNYHALWVYGGGISFANPSLERASVALTGNTNMATKIMFSLPMIVSKEKAIEAANEYIVSRSAMRSVVQKGVAEYIKSGVKEVACALKEVLWDW